MSPEIQLRTTQQNKEFLHTYIFSTDHKIVGLQYFFLSLFAVLIGMALSWLMRIHVAWSEVRIFGLELLSPTGAPGGVMTPEYYLSLMTLHGTTATQNSARSAPTEFARKALAGSACIASAKLVVKPHDGHG